MLHMQHLNKHLDFYNVVEIRKDNANFRIEKNLFGKALESSGYSSSVQNIESLCCFLTEKGCVQDVQRHPYNGLYGTYYTNALFVNNSLNVGFRKEIQDLNKLISYTYDENSVIKSEDIILQLEKLGYLSDQFNIKCVEIYLSSVLKLKKCYSYKGGNRDYFYRNCYFKTF